MSFKGVYRDDPCPYCGAETHPWEDKPALEVTGWNPKSGTLYFCHACTKRVTEASVETGETDVLKAVDEAGGPPTDYSDYKAGLT